MILRTEVARLILKKWKRFSRMLIFAQFNDEASFIFRKLCKIAQGVEDDQKEIQEKEKVKEREQEEKKKEKEEEKEIELMRRKRLFGYSEPVYYSKKMSRSSSLAPKSRAFVFYSSF